MTVGEILEKCNHLKVGETRVSSHDYDERVIYIDEIDQWNAVFTEIFGSPAKPPGAKTTKRDFSLTVDYGGLFDNQTLFYKKFDEKSMITMFWPWKDGVRVTLKVICFQE